MKDLSGKDGEAAAIIDAALGEADAYSDPRVLASLCTQDLLNDILGAEGSPKHLEFYSEKLKEALDTFIVNAGKAAEKEERRRSAVDGRLADHIIGARAASVDDRK